MSRWALGTLQLGQRALLCFGGMELHLGSQLCGLFDFSKTNSLLSFSAHLQSAFKKKTSARSFVY